MCPEDDNQKQEPQQNPEITGEPTENPHEKPASFEPGVIHKARPQVERRSVQSEATEESGESED